MLMVGCVVLLFLLGLYMLVVFFLVAFFTL